MLVGGIVCLGLMCAGIIGKKPVQPQTVSSIMFVVSSISLTISGIPPKSNAVTV